MAYLLPIVTTLVQAYIFHLTLYNSFLRVPSTLSSSPLKTPSKAMPGDLTKTTTDYATSHLWWLSSTRKASLNSSGWLTRSFNWTLDFPTAFIPHESSSAQVMHLPAGPSVLNAPQPALLRPRVIFQGQAQKSPLSNTSPLLYWYNHRIKSRK